MFTIIKHVLTALGRDEKGATAIEYGLLAALIALAIIAGASVLGNNISDLFEGIASNLASQTPS
ncbi:Flp family type IVb pilin [Roseospira goensis]|uniref:Pilus assembly protein Flp/PilA n=1 Tax=Roseospira goensis TaxID=391922 RepID=A0A7W6S1C0_9PROT|nr:Flp family type IVb pilin [Roseospira goensis]MBB4287091.1 pilus assembly protein Flp/PilA [Roseospira goensis]